MSRIRTRLVVQFGKDGLADTGFNHTDLKLLYCGLVQARDGPEKLAHRIGTAQCSNCHGCELRIVKWTANGLNLGLQYNPFSIQYPGIDRLFPGDIDR